MTPGQAGPVREQSGVVVAVTQDSETTGEIQDSASAGGGDVHALRARGDISAELEQADQPGLALVNVVPIEALSGVGVKSGALFPGVQISHCLPRFGLPGIQQRRTANSARTP